MVFASFFRRARSSIHNYGLGASFLVVATANLLTVGLAAYLQLSTSRIYRNALEASHTYNTRLASLLDLGEYIALVNAPGNDVFRSKDVAGERARVATALAAYRRQSATAKRAFDQHLTAEDPQMLRMLGALDRDVEQVAVIADEIFRQASRNEWAAAGQAMARMDAQHSQAVASMAGIGRELSSRSALSRLQQEQLIATWQQQGFGLLIIVTSVVMAVTGRTHRLASALSQTEQSLKRYKQLVDCCSDAVITASPNGSILSWNDGAERLFEYSSAEILGRPLGVLLPEDHQVEELLLLERIHHGDSVPPLETVRLTRSGKIVDVSLTLSPLRNEKGDVLGVSAIARDVSDRKRADSERQQYLTFVDDARLRLGRQAIALERQAAELAEAKSAAEQASRTKSEFLANMSHELRTPMNSIIGFTKRLIKRLSNQLTPQDADALQTVDRNARHLLGLINDILDLSKIEAGRMELNRTTFNLCDMLREVAGQTASLLDGKPVRLELVLPDEPLPVEADRTKLLQVATNLVSNGIKYTEKGLVTLSVNQSTDVELGETVAIVVRDTGVGIKAEDRERLFQKFSQLDGSSRRAVGGTGLGLFISGQYMRMHGGGLDVESEYGVGSTFSAVLPLIPREKSGGDEASDGQSPAFHDRCLATRYRILCVGVEIDWFEATQSYLDYCGHLLMSATDLDDAARVAGWSSADVLCLDARSSRMNPRDLVNAVRESPMLGALPLIVYGVDASKYDHNGGPTLFFESTLPPDEFIEVVNAIANSSAGDVLVVEDDPDTQKLLATAIRERQLQVRTAENGAAGLALLAHRRPSAIVLDLMMPFIDGFAFLDQLRQNPEWRSIPVVVSTVKSLTADETAFLAERCQRIVLKGNGETSLLVDAVCELHSESAEFSPLVAT